MIGAPYPTVVDNDVVAVDFLGFSAGSGSSTADPEVHIADRRGVGCVAGARRARYANLEEHRRVDRAGVNQESGELHSAHIGHGESGVPDCGTISA